MDKEYRIALKNHLMTAFAINKTDHKEKNPKTTTPQLVQTIFATPSVISRSRIIDALIDTPLQTPREGFDHEHDHEPDDDADTGVPRVYCKSVGSPQPHKNDFSTTEGYQSGTASSPEPQRMKGGDDKVGCGDGPTPMSSQANLSIYTFDSTHASSGSRTPSFRKRTARELSQMVLAECQLVESLNIIESERNERNELPIVLWRSKKKKFNSSIDLRFDTARSKSPTATPRSRISPPQQAIPLPPPPPDSRRRSRQSERQENSLENSGTHDYDDTDVLDAEGIIRKKFTAPLIRHVERNYVRNITATADLLKLLERMPAEIDRELARECSK